MMTPMDQQQVPTPGGGGSSGPGSVPPQSVGTPTPGPSAGGAQAHGGGALVPMMPQHHMPGGPTIPLSTLIEYMIQRTYHELTVLSELLPRKTDLDRKIEIVQFAHRTRQSFIRLLALVKWAGSAGKVEKCSEIAGFLDQQAMLFIDSADFLARMARETLVQARLPSFPLPCAIDVLTTGTYSRLPTCIKDKIVVPDPITFSEKRATLQRLSQLIEHRLVTKELPEQMRSLRIENGRVTFTVKHEFCVTLTLMADDPNIPWRLLDIEILVEDPETGSGKALVHSLQVNYIHQLAQSRMIDNDAALHDLYSTLHFFCQSLQLEVLHSQAQSLMQQRLGDHIRVEEYRPVHHLTLSYWRNGKQNRKASGISGANVNMLPHYYKLSIHIDEYDSSKPLQVSHHPPIQGSESIKVAQAIRNDYLSIDKLLISTVQVRALVKLRDLERELRCMVPGNCSIQDVPSVLYVPVVYPCMGTEKIAISVDMQLGNFVVTSAIENAQTELSELEDCLNNNRFHMRVLLSKLRVQLGMNRCKKSLQYITVRCYHKLPIVNMSGHALQQLSKKLLYVCIPDQNDYFLVVDVCEGNERDLKYKYYLLHVTPTTHSNTGAASLVAATGVDDEILTYYEAGDLMSLDTFTCTQGPGSKIHDPVEQEANPYYRKRRLIAGPCEMFSFLGATPPASKKHKSPDFYIPELVHMVAMCKDRIPLVNLASELSKREIPHQGIQVDADSSCLCLTLLDLPDVPSANAKESALLKSALLSCKFTMQKKLYNVELVFADCPLKITKLEKQVPVQRLYFTYDVGGSELLSTVIEKLVRDWISLVQLYSAVVDFADVYNSNDYLKSNIEILSYNYKKLVLAYGPNKSLTVRVQYEQDTKGFRLSFHTVSSSTASNPHNISATHLTDELNLSHSLVDLAQVLIYTCYPLLALNKLSSQPIVSYQHKPQQPSIINSVSGFSVVPQSSTHFRVLFRNLSSLDIRCMSEEYVLVRDGAFSMFDASKPLNNHMPLQSLKKFLHVMMQEFKKNKEQQAGTSAQYRPTVPDYSNCLLPQKLFSPTSLPTMVSPELFYSLMVPSLTPFTAPHIPLQVSADSCALERFMGCSYLLMQIQHQLKNLSPNIQSLTSTQIQPSSDFDILIFNSNNLQYRITFNQDTYQALNITVLPLQLQDNRGQWPPFDTEVFERCFEKCIIRPPYKGTFAHAFVQLVTAPTLLLKQLVLILKLQFNPEPLHKWLVELCFVAPFMANGIPVGNVALLWNTEKIIFVVNFTRKSDSQKLPVAFMYELKSKTIKLLEETRLNAPALTPTMQALSNLLKTFCAYNQPSQQECRMYPAIREIAQNFNA